LSTGLESTRLLQKFSPDKIFAGRTMHYEKIIALVLFLIFLISYTSTQRANESRDFTQLPSELSAVDWTRTPEDIVTNPKKSEPLVWIGLVKEVLVYQKEAKVEIDWVCQHLTFVDPSPAAISKRPIRVRKGSGVFGVSLVMENMSLDEAKKFQTQHTLTPHYLLAGGTFGGMKDWKGSKVPFINTSGMAVGPKLAQFKE
jgi:hypothetical protein